jgi:hypothetical protein
MKRLASIAALLCIAAMGVVAGPHEANAWWRRGFGVEVWAPPVFVAPPGVIYGPPVAAYPSPYPPYYPVLRHVWVPPHREGPYWVRGHWS